MTHRYVILIEPTATGYSAWSPDVPGCVATGESAESVESNMQQAIIMHLDALRADGQPVPESQTIAAYVEVAA